MSTPSRRGPGHPPWRYEPDENPKRKHKGVKPEPEIVFDGNKFIGKCPSNLSLKEAERLLNGGIPWNPPDWSKPWPKKIYVVHEGVPYCAVVTQEGRSYHGFPEHPANLMRLLRRFLEDLGERARQMGRESDFRRWMKRRWEKT